MNSNRPYLLRGLYEWIVDNKLTPYVLVDASFPKVEVPEQYVEDGKIILNISANAVHDLLISNQLVEFDASFNGAPYQISVPIKAVLAIYARENGRGMVFQEDEEGEAENQPPVPPSRSSRSRKPKLTVVK